MELNVGILSCNKEVLFWDYKKIILGVIVSKFGFGFDIRLKNKRCGEKVCKEIFI